MIIKNGEILAIDHIAHDNTLSGNGTSAKPVGLSQSTKELIDSKVKKTDFETYKSSAANQISNINTKITTDESNFETYKASAHDEIARVDGSIAAVNAAKVDKTTFTQYQTDVANNFTAVNKRIDDVDAAKQDKGEYVSAADFNSYKSSAHDEIARVDGRIDATNTNLDNNYYDITETYNKTEVDEKFANFGGFKFRDPDPEHGNQPLTPGEVKDPKAIYLTQPEGATQYLQWIWNTEVTPNVWKCIGDTTMDLSDYAKTVDVVQSANNNVQAVENWANATFATKTDLNNDKSELEGEINNLENKIEQDINNASADIINKIDTTSAYLDDKIDAVIDTLEDDYYTSEQIDARLAASGSYYTQSQVDEILEKYVKSTDLNPIKDDINSISADVDTLSSKVNKLHNTVIESSDTVIATSVTKLDGTIFYTLSAHDGKQADYLWKPTVNAAGDISWELALTGDTPDPANIKGPQGIQGVSGTPGKDGENGITPKLKIDKNDIWNVSYDNEETWTSLGVSATGPKGETGAQGPQGDEGDEGKPGFSPTVDAVAITDGEKTGTKITFTYKDAQGQEQTTVYSAWNGINGEGATVYFNGVDGIEISAVDTTYFNVGLSAAYKKQVEDVSGKQDALTQAQLDYIDAVPVLSAALDGFVTSGDISTQDTDYVMTTTGWKVLTLPGGGMTQVIHDTTLTGQGNDTNRMLGVAWSALSGNTVNSALSANSAYSAYSASYATTAASAYIDTNTISAMSNIVDELHGKLDSTAAATTYQTKVDMSAYLPLSGGTVSGKTTISGSSFDALEILRGGQTSTGTIGITDDGVMSFKITNSSSNNTQLNIASNATMDKRFSIGDNLYQPVAYLIPAVTATTTAGLTDDKILHIIVES